MSKNLFEIYEVNGRQYTDNLGHNAFISIPKEQYIEYEQLKEENKQLKEEIKKIVVDNLAQINIERESEFVSLILKIIQEKEEIIYKAIEYNKSILKENWYGGNEKKYAKTNLEILGDKE